MNNYRWNKWNRFTSKARIVTLGAVRLYIRQHEQWRWSIRSAFHAGQSKNRRRRWFHTGDFCDRVVRLSFQLHAQRTATKFLWWCLDFGITWKRENFGISACFSFSSDLQLPPANSSFCAIALSKKKKFSYSLPSFIYWSSHTKFNSIIECVLLFIYYKAPVSD